MSHDMWAFEFVSILSGHVEADDLALEVFAQASHEFLEVWIREAVAARDRGVVVGERDVAVPLVHLCFVHTAGRPLVGAVQSASLAPAAAQLQAGSQAEGCVGLPGVEALH